MIPYHLPENAPRGALGGVIGGRRTLWDLPEFRLLLSKEGVVRGAKVECLGNVAKIMVRLVVDIALLGATNPVDEYLSKDCGRNHLRRATRRF
jgi:hypothetical protein